MKSRRDLDELQLAALGVLAWWLLRKRPDVGAAVVEDLVPAPRATVAALAGTTLEQALPAAAAGDVSAAGPAPSGADLLPPPGVPDVLLPTAEIDDGFHGGGGGQSGGAGASGAV